jgi:hypothetical protein
MFEQITEQEGNMAGPVETSIRKNVHKGQILRTSSGSSTFVVGNIDTNGIILLFGQKQTETFFPWFCLEDVPAFLKGKGWVEIGTKFDVSSKPGTLDEYMKQTINRATATWVAALLAKIDIVEINRKLPMCVRLK